MFNSSSSVRKEEEVQIEPNSPSAIRDRRPRASTSGQTSHLMPKVSASGQVTYSLPPFFIREKKSLSWLADAVCVLFCSGVNALSFSLSLPSPMHSPRPPTQEPRAASTALHKKFHSPPLTFLFRRSSSKVPPPLSFLPPATAKQSETGLYVIVTKDVPNSSSRGTRLGNTRVSFNKCNHRREQDNS